MYHLQHFIASNGSWIQAVLFSLLFLLTWNLENIAGLIYDYKKWKHAFVNAPFAFTNIPGQLLLGSLLQK